MLKLVNTTRTSCSTKDFVMSCSKAWFNLYKALPKKSQIAVIYAQNALETGNTHNMWNWNIGNVKAIDTPGMIIEYCVLKNVWEVINGKKIFLKPEDPGSWFRAFPTLDLGVEFHISFLRNKRYKVAWTAVEKGDPLLFSHLLRQQGYYTAPEADYNRAMQYHYATFMNGKTFDLVQQELAGFYNAIGFPADYTPIEFNIKEDQFDKPEPLKVAAPTWTQKLINILKGQ